MQFKPYPKIHRLGKDETLGILEGTVHIQEKVDGANASIWLEEDGIHCGSRTQDVTQKPFRGLGEYSKSHEGINDYLVDNPTHRLYGEWLVRHTIGYNESSYNQFYLFEIDTPEGVMDIHEMYQIAHDYRITTVHFVGTLTNPAPEDVQEFVGKSMLGDKGEGVVIKNLLFRNSFGDPCHAKIVTESFKEDNGILFGGNNKHSESYEEMYIVNKYITLERIKKIIQKLESMNGPVSIKDCSQVASLAYHDMLTEEIWEIAKRKMVVDFRMLQALVNKKAIFVFKDILTNGENARITYNPIQDAESNFN